MSYSPHQNENLSRPARSESKSDPFFADGDERVHVPHGDFSSEAGLGEKVKQTWDKVAAMDRQEIREKSEDFLRRYPWQSAMIGFACGALIGRKVFRS